MQKIYLTTITVLSVISAVVPTGTMLAYGSNDQNDNNQNDNDPRNQACYKAGFGDGRQNIGMAVKVDRMTIRKL